MKVRTLVIGVLMVLVAGSALADSYHYEWGVTSMNHYRAYRWGINHDIPDDEEITSVTLKIDRIKNYNNARNEIFVGLVDYASEGRTRYYDSNDDFVDYFAGWGVALEHYTGLTTTRQTLTYDFTAAEIDALEEYRDNNNFGITVDPDCHYYLCGIELWINTDVTVQEEPGVPEPASLGVIGLALLGIRRRRRS
jgi:PEP-CTERM motif-containing protein